MYTPTFDITHRMVQHLISLELCLRDIKTTPLQSIQQRDIRNDNATVNISSVAKLSGLELSDTDARSIALGQTIAAPGSEKLILTNYRSTSDFIYATIDDPYLSLSPALLLHINKLLMNGVVESWEAGRFRAMDDEVNPAADSWIKNRAKVVESEFIDPQRHFMAVLDWFSKKGHVIHPALKIGCVLFELYRTYPFVAGNLITMIALSELLISRSKLNLRGLLPAAQHLNQNSEPYQKILHTTMTSFDQTMWLEQFVKGLGSSLELVRSEVLRKSSRHLKTDRKKILELNPRQQKLMRNFSYHPRTSRRDYVRMTGVSAMTAFRDIEELVKRKLIVQKGGGRSTYYELPSDTSSDVQTLSTGHTREVVRVINDLSQTPDEAYSGSVFTAFSNDEP